jgi:hypothetical protein
LYYTVYGPMERLVVTETDLPTSANGGFGDGDSRFTYRKHRRTICIQP